MISSSLPSPMLLLMNIWLMQGGLCRVRSHSGCQDGGEGDHGNKFQQGAHAGRVSGEMHRR